MNALVVFVEGANEVGERPYYKSKAGNRYTVNVISS
jgi:hypothetical protein